MNKLNVAMVVVALACFEHGAMVLAKRGESAQYAIVLPANASPSAVFTAKELQRYTEKMTGVKLPIATEEKSQQPRSIFLKVMDCQHVFV